MNNLKRKMPNINVTLVFTIIILWVFSSCTDNFEEINTDPNGKAEVPTPFLLTSAQQKLITLNSSLAYNKTMMFLSQLWSQRETTNRSRYDLSVEGDWRNFYSNGLPDLNSIISFNAGDKKEEYSAYGDNDNQIAVARIMKAWAFSLMTDTWGDIPYSQAFDVAYNSPAYDRQSDLYPNLIKELKEAAAMMDTSKEGFSSGDLMYGGDMSKWKKFANSLRARLALRMSNVDAAAAQSELADALGAEGFSSNDDNAMIAFQQEEANANPLYIEYLVQKWTLPSEILVERLKTLADPRLSVYAEPNVSNAEYVGLPYGLGDDQSTDWAEDTLSLPGAKVREATFPSILMTYSELSFIKAEAAQRGWISGDPAVFYNDAISANMSFWGVGQSAVDTYLAGAKVVYDAANWEQRIGEQRWLSMYTQGAQAYFGWRRLGQPVLPLPNHAALFNDVTEIPRRFFYPVAEQSLNGEELEKAIVQMGGNTLMTRMWLDPR